MKQTWKPGTVLYPLPAVLVSCGARPDEYNMLTVAWTGTVCTNPPMCYISVRPERHSYGIIRRTGEFVINLTTRDLARATDWCGVRSGRDCDKFREMGLTPAPAGVVAAPIIVESPVNIECRVRQVLPLGSHDMFRDELNSKFLSCTFFKEFTILSLSYSSSFVYFCKKSISSFIILVFPSFPAKSINIKDISLSLKLFGKAIL